MAIVTFLHGEKAMTKSFIAKNNDNPPTHYTIDSSQQRQMLLSSQAYTISTINELYLLLAQHAEAGGCLFSGTLTRPLINESRANMASPLTPVETLYLDIDYLPIEFETPQQFIAFLGIENTAYIIKASASNSIPPKKRRSYHAYFLLDQPYTHTHLTALIHYFNQKWLKSQPIASKNFTTPNHTTLNNLNTDIKYPLDPATTLPASLIFIAPPIITNPHLSQSEHLRQHPKPTFQLLTTPTNNDRLSLAPFVLSDYPQTPQTRLRGVNRYKTANRQDQVKESDLKWAAKNAQVTGIREDREWVRLNLNGGDSWGWYHHKDNPTHIFSFITGESYPIREITPDYARTLQEQKVLAKQKRTPTTTDSNTNEPDRCHTNPTLQPPTQQLPPDQQIIAGYTEGQLFQGIYNINTYELLQYNTVRAKQTVEDFYKSYDELPPSVLPQYGVIYNPIIRNGVDTQNYTINLYRPSEIQPAQTTTPYIPRMIKAIIRNALGLPPATPHQPDNEPLFQHFINWVACIVSLKIQTQTAYLLWGFAGTGKSLVINNILSPLVGVSNTHKMNTARELESQFNGQLSNKILLAIEETYAKSYEDQEKIYNLLKTVITDTSLSIRKLYSDHATRPNLVNVILTSNKPHALHLEASDRRVTVAHYQSIPLKQVLPETGSQTFVNDIEAELPMFYAYLLKVETDQQLARQALLTKDKQSLIDRSQPTQLLIVQKIIQGDFGFLQEAIIPNSGAIPSYSQHTYEALILLIESSKTTSLTKSDLIIIIKQFYPSFNPNNIRDMFESQGASWTPRHYHTYKKVQEAGIININWQF